MYILSHSLSTRDGETGLKDVQITSEIPQLMKKDRLVEATFIGTDGETAASFACSYITVRSELGDEFLFPIGAGGKRCKSKGHCSALQHFFEESGELRLNLIDGHSGKVKQVILPIEAFESERAFVLAGVHHTTQNDRAQGEVK